MFYFQSTPPLYDVSRMETPVALFWGSQDSLADPADVRLLIPKLRNVVFNKEFPGWMHLDFIWAMGAPTACYSDILRMMSEKEAAIAAATV